MYLAYSIHLFGLHLFSAFFAFVNVCMKFDGKRFDLGNLNDLEVKKQYQIEITNKFAELGNISDDGDINRAWENIKEDTKT